VGTFEGGTSFGVRRSPPRKQRHRGCSLRRRLGGHVWSKAFGAPDTMWRSAWSSTMALRLSRLSVVSTVPSISAAVPDVSRLCGYLRGSVDPLIPQDVQPFPAHRAASGTAPDAARRSDCLHLASKKNPPETISGGSTLLQGRKGAGESAYTVLGLTVAQSWGLTTVAVVLRTLAVLGLAERS